MTTEARFKYALKEMMLEKPLAEINVTLLCNKCGCHRQTFYYHYQDIYDLLAAIFLNEKVELAERATDTSEILEAFFSYAKTNFDFLKATYNSAAHDLVDDFFSGKITARLFTVLSISHVGGLNKETARLVARRYAKIVGDEIGYCFKDATITPAKFEHSIRKFLDTSLSTIFPALIECAKKEKAR